MSHRPGRYETGWASAGRRGVASTTCARASTRGVAGAPARPRCRPGIVDGAGEGLAERGTVSSGPITSIGVGALNAKSRAIARPSSAVAIRPWPVRLATKQARSAASRISSAVRAVAREGRDADRDADAHPGVGPAGAGLAERVDGGPDPLGRRRARTPRRPRAGSGRTRRRHSGRPGPCRGRLPRSRARSRRGAGRRPGGRGRR